MNSGVNILCKKLFGQFLLTNNPYCIINNIDVRELQWDHINFIPLMPNIPYSFLIQVNYMGGPMGGIGFSVFVQPGEIQNLEYKTPFTIFSPGKIRRI